MSAFCSGLCNEISRCCYDFYHAPFTKKNLLIGGGVLLGIIILIIIIVCAVGPSYSGIESGSEVIKHHPLVDGANSLSYNLKDYLMDQLNLMPESLNSNLSQFWTIKECKRCQTDLLRLKKGYVATQVFSLTTDCDAQYKDSVSQILEQIDLFRRIVSNPSYRVSLVKEADDIAKFYDSKTTGAILNVWGGHNIDSRLAVLRMYYDLGVRIMALASGESKSICYPSWLSSTGLTDFGKKVVEEMNRLGMMIDLTGSPDKVQEDVLNLTKAPVIYSHSAADILVSNELNIKNETLQMFGKKMQLGLVMVPFSPNQLSSKETSTISDIGNHLKKLLSFLPSTKIGIGSNFDNMTATTEKLDDVSKFPHFFDHLWSPKEKTFTEQVLKEMASSNFINVFKAVEKESKNLKKKLPDDGIIPRNAYKETSCYSDFGTRYSSAIPTPAPTPTSKPPTTAAATTTKTPTSSSTTPKST